MYGGEECFLVYLYHLTQGTPFTEMACFIFRGDPCRLLEMNDLFISHGYYTFYNKISGTSLDQWIPQKLDTCWGLIHNALVNDTIEEVHYVDGEVVNRQWIIHNFDFNSFQIFGFLDDFGMTTSRPGSSASRRHDYVTDIQRAFYLGYLVVTD